MFRASCPTAATRSIDADAWALPQLFAFLQAGGAIEPGELARTFNCGIGMVAIVRESDVGGGQRGARSGRARRCSGSAASKRARAAAPSAGSAGTWSAREAWSANHDG